MTSPRLHQNHLYRNQRECPEVAGRVKPGGHSPHLHPPEQPASERPSDLVPNRGQNRDALPSRRTDLYRSTCPACGSSLLNRVDAPASDLSQAPGRRTHGERQRFEAVVADWIIEHWPWLLVAAMGIGMLSFALVGVLVSP